MKSLREAILDVVANTYLFEMAVRQQEAKKEIASKAMQITRHWIKLQLMPKSVDVNKWNKEIKNWFRNYESLRLKPNSKGLTLEQGWEWFSDFTFHMKTQEDLDRIVQHVKEDYPEANKSAVKLKYKDLENFVKQQFKNHNMR